MSKRKHTNTEYTTITLLRSEVEAIRKRKKRPQESYADVLRREGII